LEIGDAGMRMPGGVAVAGGRKEGRMYYCGEGSYRMFKIQVAKNQDVESTWLW
jgi:hypothetical protein